MTWFPKLHSHSDKLVQDHLEHDPELRSVRRGRRFPFAATEVNLGRRTVCHNHKDYKNAAVNVCLDAAFGPFDHTKGRHLVLHELGVAVELAPGDIFFFPSALITHQNVGIAKGEKRYSITAFTAGSLYQLRDQKFYTKKSLMEMERQKKGLSGGKGETKKQGLDRFVKGWELFSTLNELMASCGMTVEE